MPGKFESPRPAGGKSNKLLLAILAILLVAIVVVGILLVVRLTGNDDRTAANQNQTDPVADPTGDPTTEDPTTDGSDEEQPTPPTEEITLPTEPEPIVAVATATITSTGDVLPHSGVINAGLQKDGSYDFTHIYQYIAPYLAESDYSVANLETTLCGLDNGYPYSGYPQFNAPDEIAEYAMAAGFDMFLTANNHCNDTGYAGITRTVTTVREMGMDTLGTVPTPEDPNYLVVEVNGIRIGMMCYTYSTTNGSGRPVINGIPTSEESQYLINTFDYNRLDDFYTEVTGYMDAMDADVYMLYIHWGNEYQRSPNSYQQKIAQALCDLGIDVIVGGHPHVIQPIDLLTSTTDPEHSTVCMYSMGNAVSNQRLGLIPASTTAHTEDGMLFSVTFTKYSDGTVALTYTDILPCWVNRHDTNGSRQYDILPLDDATRDQWAELYGLTNYTLTCCEDSYDRTAALVSEGLLECQTFLTEREAAFLAEVNGEQ